MYNPQNSGVGGRPEDQKFRVIVGDIVSLKAAWTLRLRLCLKTTATITTKTQNKTKKKDQTNQNLSKTLDSVLMNLLIS